AHPRLRRLLRLGCGATRGRARRALVDRRRGRAGRRFRRRPRRALADGAAAQGRPLRADRVDAVRPAAELTAAAAPTPASNPGSDTVTGTWRLRAEKALAPPPPRSDHPVSDTAVPGGTDATRSRRRPGSGFLPAVSRFADR